MDREIERLEERLEELGRGIAYPETPPIAQAVSQRLAERPKPRRAAAWALAAVAVTAIAVIFVAIISVASPARDAVADIFDRINIFESDEAPPAGTPTEIEGEELMLAQAEERLGAEILLPDGMLPEGVLFQDFGAITAVALFFDDDAGEFVLFETNAGVEKTLSPGATWETVEGLEGDAYWLEGLRIVQYSEPGGGTIESSVRATDTNTLIWEQGRYVFRLEGNLSLEEAVVIAQSLR